MAKLKLLRLALLVLLGGPEPVAAALARQLSLPTSTDLVPPWAGLLVRLDAERPLYAGCDADPRRCAGTPLGRWRALIATLRDVPDEQALVATNSFVMGVPYVPEPPGSLAAEDWRSPAQTLVQGGDCEDRAFLRYVTLRELGFGTARLRIVQLHRPDGEAHAVLAVRRANGFLILDDGGVPSPDDQLDGGWTAIFAINEDQAWRYAGNGNGLPVR